MFISLLMKMKYNFEKYDVKIIVLKIIQKVECAKCEVKVYFIYPKIEKR